MNEDTKKVIVNGMHEAFNQGVEISAQTVELIVEALKKIRPLSEDEKRSWLEVTTLIRSNKVDISNGEENTVNEGN